MQYLGLQKILTLISTDPSDLIISRYVSLVQDIQNESDKAQSLLNLATIMLDIDPQETLKYSLPVFEHNQSLEALQLIYRAVVALGKDDKARVIKREIERLKSIESSKSFNRSSPTSLNRKHSTILLNDGSSSQQDTVLIDNPSVYSNPTSHLPSRSVPPTRPTGRDTISTPVDQITQSMNQNTGSYPPPSFNRASRTTSIPNSSLNQMMQSDYSYSSSVPSAEPTPAYTPKDQRDSVEAVLMELFDFYWKNGLIKEAHSLLNGCSPSYSSSPW